jgi:DNA-binding HxlR family transcriptional regulator
MRRTSTGDSICPIARSLDEIGDWWTILIVRDAFGGKKRFSEFQRSLGLAKNILSDRLSMLVARGIMEKRSARHAGSRGEYHLTEKGRELRLVLTAIRQWGEDHLFAAGEPMTVLYDRLNRPVGRLRLMDQDGRPLMPDEMMVTEGRKTPLGKARMRVKKRVRR